MCRKPVIEPELEAYFYKTRDFWKEYISKNVSLDLKMLEENESYLDWRLVSQNKAIQWSPEIIQRFEANWNWMKLTRNGSLYRKIKNIEHLITHYSERWSWKYLQKRRKYLYTDELQELNQSRQVRFTEIPPLASDIYALRFPESPENWLEIPKEQWRYMPLRFRYAGMWSWSHIDGARTYDERKGFREFLSNNIENVNWTVLSSFGGLTPELIKEFEAEWDWMALSQNPSLPYSLNFLEQYMHKWKWPILAAHRRDIAAKFTNYLSKENSLLKKFPDFFSSYEVYNYARSPEAQMRFFISKPLTMNVLQEAIQDEQLWILCNLVSPSKIAWSKPLFKEFEEDWLVPLMTIPSRVFRTRWTADLIHFLLRINS